MKKVLQINLGGVPFTVDDDAYRRLDAYMLDLGRYFSRSGSQDDIIADIESRIAEIFTELLKARKIVEITDVEAAIKVMGTPEDFGENSSSYERTSSGPWDIKTGKKLFRNPDDKVIGGVCSGLSAYFGVSEVLWMRLGFAIVFLTMGVGLLVYILIWALVPEAKTAADRLAMMGEPANAQNIGRMVERGIEDLSTTIKHNWKHWNSKKKSIADATSGTGDTVEKSGVMLLAMLLLPLILIARVARVIVHRLRRHRYHRPWRCQSSHYV
jgi:phage shock protein PspC (stress-responsive transcriptional regulator)